jgi:hypothetical protein
MAERTRFPDDVLEALRAGKILGIRAGTGPHRFIGLWMVVAGGRLFVRSWSQTPGGWHDTLLKDPRATIQIAGREIRVRAVRTRSERLMDAVDRAYREKYRTPGALKYVRDLTRSRCRGTTTELVPVA